jgi:hypothetical protein
MWCSRPPIPAWVRRFPDDLPPPLLWTQNPCFLEVTDRGALQNLHNKGVTCKIVQDKELRDVLVSFGRLWMKNGVKANCRDYDLKENF